MENEIIIKNMESESINFDTLFRLYYAPMVLYATRFFKEKETAEDVVQDVFMQLLSKNKTILVNKNMRNFLITVLHNKIIDRIRSDKKQQTERLNELWIEETIEETAFTVDLYARLYEEIEKLPVKNAQVMKLKLDGKDDHEIAEILGIKYETVRSHVKHGISSLRGKFDIVLLITIFS